MPGSRISPAPRAFAVAAIFLACALLVPATTRRVRSMNGAELRRILEPYVQALHELSLEDPVLSRRSFRQEIQEDPLQHYSLEAKQSLVMKEYLKTGIGMPALIALPGDIPPYFPRHADR